MIRINVAADGNSKKTAIRIYAPVQAYSSNLTITDPTAALVGDIVSGVVSANYIGSGRAQLSAWKLADLGDWRSLAPDTLFGDHYGDFEEWTAEWPLVWGGAGFDEHAPVENRISGIRPAPPQEDPHIYLRERRERINKEDRGADFSLPPSFVFPAVLCAAAMTR